MNSRFDATEQHEFDIAPPDDNPVVVSAAPDIWKVAFSHKWLILAGSLLGLVAGQLLYLKLGPTYEAQSRILVAKRTTAQIRTTETATLGDRAEHIALIMSPLIVGEAVKKRHLDKLPSIDGAPDPVQEILDCLRVKRSAGDDKAVLNVLDITYTSSKPKESTVVVDAVIEAYRDYLSATRQEYANESVQLITQASQDLVVQLRQKEKEYVAFRERAPLYFRNAPGTDATSSDTTNVHQDRLLAIEAERRLNILKRAEVNSKLKALEQAIARGEPQQSLEVLVRQFLNSDGKSGALDTASQIDALRAQLLPLIVEEGKLLRDFGEEHPQVQTVRKSIKTIESFYSRQGIVLPQAVEPEVKGKPKSKRPVDPNRVDFVAIYLTSLKQQLAELEFRDVELAELFAEADKNSKLYARFQVEDQTLNGEIKRLKTLWEAVVTRLNDINLAKDNGGYTLKQIAPAREGIVIKRQIQLLGMLGALGFLCAFALSYIRELRDNRLKSVADIQQHFGPRVIGRIPSMALWTPQELSAHHSVLDPSLEYVFRPGSEVSEALRGVRTALFFCTATDGHRVIQVTSAEPEDGKTTISSNLAIAIAHSGKRVLLVDADLRRPRVHKLFGLKAEIGLSDVLQGEILLENAIRETEVAHLSLLCAGMTPANPAEILGGQEFDQTIQELRKQFDYVIVDSPPLLAVSDSRVVAARTDGMLLVVRLAKTTHTAVSRTQELLTSQHVKLLGVIANGVEAGRQYGYGYAYGERPTGNATRSEAPRIPFAETSSV